MLTKEYNGTILNTVRYIAGWSSWQLVGLITRRSQVRVLPPQPKEMKRYSHNGCSTSAFRKRYFRGVKGVSNIEKRDKHDKTEKIEKGKFSYFILPKIKNAYL